MCMGTVVHWPAGVKSGTGFADCGSERGNGMDSELRET